MQNGQIQQQAIPNELLGPLKEFSAGPDNGAEMRRHLTDDGYVFLRDVLDRDEVLAAREEVFNHLEQVGEIQSPAIEGIATGQSNREEVSPDLNCFWQAVSEGTALRAISHGERVRELMQTLFDEPARPHDLMYLRTATVGYATRLHYDYPFFAGRSERIHTVWIPLGDAAVIEGPLAMVEGSNRFDDLINPVLNVDYGADRSNDVVQQAAYDDQNATDPLTLIRNRRTRLLSADFRAGDLMIFGGCTMHGSLDNHSPLGRVRLSCDVRYQPASDRFDDPRYFGSHPTGSKGGGYGDMKAAQPLVEIIEQPKA